MLTLSLTAVEITAARLPAIELFQGLYDNEILELLTASDDLSFQAGDVVFQAGEINQSLYILFEGSVEIDLEVPKLSERVVARLEAGSVFGESSFFHAAPHAATAKCVTAARIFRLSRARFDTLAASNPQVALRITANAAQILAARLQHADEWIVDTLTRQHEHEVRDKWRSMRQGLMSSFRSPQPIISVGANLS